MRNLTHMHLANKYVLPLLTLFCMITINTATDNSNTNQENNINNVSLEEERQQEALNNEVADIPLQKIEQKDFVNLYTQSQALLRLPDIRETIEKLYGDKIVPYFNIISQAIVKEAELKKSHYVFYNAAPSITAVLSDLYTQLYFYQHPEEKDTMDDTFRFLQFQGEKKDMTAQEFLADELSKNGLVDDSGELAAYLLSVNLSLFGNAKSKTECTWRWFVENLQKAPDSNLCKIILDQFGLSHKYVDEIMALNDIISTPEATLLQICIPQETVDKLVYLAWIGGVPASGPIINWIKEFQSSKGKDIDTDLSRETLSRNFRKQKEKNPLFRDFMRDLEAGNFSTEAFLKAYCNKPLELENISETEGRILFTKEGLHNPASGIKFYRYLTTPGIKLKEYTDKLNEIVQKLVDELEAKATA